MNASRWTGLCAIALFWTALPRLEAQKYSNEFLAIGVGARAQAMGNAVIASCADVSAGVWNPAGLADPERAGKTRIGAMHAEWFAGVGKFDYLAAALPMAQEGRVLGISLIRFGIDEIPNTLSLYESDGTVNFENIREFSAADYALVLSHARLVERSKGQWLLGGNVKIIHRRIGPFANSWGFGLDLGAQYIRKDWRFGVLARDLTNTFNAWSFRFTEAEKEVLQLSNNEIPINSIELTRPQVLLGAYKRFALSPKFGLAPELSAHLTTDGKRNTLLPGEVVSIDPAFGIEADLRKMLFLRGGVNQFQRETDFGGKTYYSPRPSVGVGFRFGGLYIDYAFTDLAADQNTYSHIVSLSLEW